MKIAYAIFLTVSLILGTRFLCQFSAAALDHWRNPDRLAGTSREWTTQEIHFPPVELDPAIQARIDTLLLNNTDAEPSSDGQDVLSDSTRDR